MKRTVLVVFAMAWLSPSLSAGTIAVTGGGNYFNDPSDLIVTWAVNFSGSNGSDYVSASDVNFQANQGSVPAGFIGASQFQTEGSGSDFASIDGTGFAPGFWSFSLGDGFGTISGYNSLNQLVATESLNGYIVVTSKTCFGVQQQACGGTFVITTPEPGSFPLALWGVSLVAPVFLLRRKADRP